MLTYREDSAGAELDESDHGCGDRREDLAEGGGCRTGREGEVGATERRCGAEEADPWGLR